jgi:hypothetical protein
MLLKKRKDRENNMRPTGMRELNGENSGRLIIESESEPVEGLGTSEKRQESPPLFIDDLMLNEQNNAGSVPSIDVRRLESPGASGVSSYVNSEMLVSESMNLLDESANHIFALMKGLTPSTQSKCSAENVNAAVRCADAIYKIMRLKLDCIKTQRKIR